MEPATQVAAPKRQRGAARKRRARRIRALTATGAVAGFCAVWSVVYAQMAAGEDPALGDGATTKGAVTSAATKISGPSETNATKQTASQESSVSAPAAATSAQS